MRVNDNVEHVTHLTAEHIAVDDVQYLRKEFVVEAEAQYLFID
jgi:hypothetical protein